MEIGPSKKDRHFLKIAKEVSKKSDYQRQNSRHTGCVIVYNGSIISKAANSGEKTSPVQKHYNKHRGFDIESKALAHAEIRALNKIKYLDIDWSKVSVYVYREGSSGQPLMSRPCLACSAMLRSYGIHRVVYSTDMGAAIEYFE